MQAASVYLAGITLQSESTQQSVMDSGRACHRKSAYRSAMTDVNSPGDVQDEDKACR
jgi:hypothetical protein